MVANEEMYRYLDNLNFDKENILENYLIEEGINAEGNVFWYAKDLFCLSIENVKEVGEELTNFEWSGNEIYIKFTDNISELLNKAISILKQWKYQMRTKYNDTSFEIIISIDEGDEDVLPSVTIRFYAIRDNYHIIDIEEINEYYQPILIEQIISNYNQELNN